MAKIRYYLTFGQGSQRFKFKKNDNTEGSISIEKAPEPEDIIWENLGISTFEKVKRKLLTYFVTFLLLGISFVAVLRLSQTKNNSDNAIII